jgi:hypothetical protein
LTDQRWGAYADIANWEAKGLDRVIAMAHLELNRLAPRLPAPAMRYGRLPFVENCALSGYPVAKVDRDPNLNGAIAAVVKARKAGVAAYKQSSSGNRAFQSHAQIR